jgi:hypothetical protein
MLAFAPVCVLFPDIMVIRREMTTIYSTVVSVKACDPNGSSLFLERPKDFVFMWTTDISPYHSTGLINGMP